MKALAERAKKIKAETVAETFDKELNKLQRMNPQVAEYPVR